MKRFLAPLIGVLALMTTAGVVLASGTTQPATSVSFTTATLNATVQVGDKVHFEYGTSALTSKTGVQTASATTYSRSISGLTRGKTYRFRVVTDDNVGTVRTFTTASAPTVSTKGVTSVTTSGAKLNATVDPNGAATGYNFEWGTSSKLGNATTAGPVGAGSRAVPVAAALGGLEQNTRYYYRVTANNAAATVRGSIKSFTTAKATINLSAFTLSVQPSRIAYGGAGTISGKLTGSGVPGVTVVLEVQPFPFNAPFAQVSTTKAAADGSYQLTTPPLLVNTNVRIVTRTTPAVVSQTTLIYSRSKVEITLRKGLARMIFRGTTQPAAANGVVRLQRRNDRGKWVTVKRGKLSPLAPDRSRYRLSVPRSRGAYRVTVYPRDGAHASGRSRVRVVR